MPWVPLDTHYLKDPKVQRAGEATPFALSVFPALLAAAKLRSEGGKVEVTFRDLAHDLFISIEDATKAVAALVAAGAMEMESQDDWSAAVRFPKATWRRWNDNFRKAVAREAESA